MTATTCTSNSFIFNVHNTGSPGHDLQRHISSLPDVLRRVFEELRLTGTQLSRIEPDITSATKQEKEVRIATIEYAAARLGSREDALEFVRCLKRIAGEGAGAQSLQQIASHYYTQARNSGTAATLGEMGILAFHLDATTAEGETHFVGEFDIEQNYIIDEDAVEVELTDDLTDAERRELSVVRAAEILDEREEHPFFAELRSQRRRAPQIAKFVEDDFRRQLHDDYMGATSSAEEIALHEQYERFEQYDENGIVSLHMSDGERVVPCGDLTDDVTFDDIPEAARHLGYEMCCLYKGGFPALDGEPREGVAGIPIMTFRRVVEDRRVRVEQVMKTSFGIDTWLDYSLEAIYCSHTVKRTMRRTHAGSGGATNYEAALRRQIEAVSTARRRRHEQIRLTSEWARAVQEYTNTRQEVAERLAQTLADGGNEAKQSPYASLFGEAADTKFTEAQREGERQIRRCRDRFTQLLATPALDCQEGFLLSRLEAVSDSTFTIDVFPDAEQHAEARAILDILLAKLKADIHMHALNTSALYRDLYAQIPVATDTAALARLRKQAWDLKQEGRLSLKFFTLLNTFAAVRIARLESEPLRSTIREGDRVRAFQVAQPVINSLIRADGKKLADIARRISRLPRQEQERVRLALKARHPELYGRVRDGLCRRIKQAPAKSYDPQIRSLGYFRWAMYPGNKTDHPSNLLTREDQAAVWTLLKARTALSAQPSTQSQSSAEGLASPTSSTSDLPTGATPALLGSRAVH